MAEQIVMIAVPVIGLLLIVNGVVSFAKRESKVYLGRRRRKLAVLTGPAGDVVALVSAIGGAVTLAAGVLYWAGLLSFAVAFIAAAISLILHQMAGFLGSLFQRHPERAEEQD
jgi:hypothetical protein